MPLWEVRAKYIVEADTYKEAKKKAHEIVGHHGVTTAPLTPAIGAIYWVSWWSKIKWAYPTLEGVKLWVSGERADGALSYCMAYTAPNADYLKVRLTIYFPDIEFRFCDPKPDTWTPGDRFK